MKPEQSAILPSNDSELPGEANKTNDSIFERIWKYYHKTRVELTPREEQIRARWEIAWRLLTYNNIKKDVANKLEKMYGIQKSLAYNDIKHAMRLFGDPSSDTKEAKRAIAETMVLRAAKRCWKNDDMDGYNKFLQKYIDINGLTLMEDDKMKEKLKNLKPTVLVFVTSQEQLKKQADELMQDIPTIDTSFEEANDQREGSAD
jgi:hypothetical protein